MFGSGVLRGRVMHEVEGPDVPHFTFCSLPRSAPGYVEYPTKWEGH